MVAKETKNNDTVSINITSTLRQNGLWKYENKNQNYNEKDEQLII